MSNPVLDNIRRALGHNEPPAPEERLQVLPARRVESAEAEIERFLEEVRKLSGSAARLSQPELEEALRRLVGENQVRAAACWRTPWLEQLGVEETLSRLGVELVSPNASKHELARCDLGVTGASYLLPETGTLALYSSAEQPRAVSLLPRIHLAIVAPHMLRADLHQVFAEAKDRHYLVLITGPSRTADIELTVTLGVHGPKSLYVWMLTEP